MKDRPSIDDLKIDRGKVLPANRPVIYASIATLVFTPIGALAGRYFWPFENVPVHVAVAQINGTPSASALDASGYVVARKTATLSAKIIGKLVKVNVEEGERVTAGQIVALLDDSNFRAALSSAQAQVRAAETALDDIRPTYLRYQKLRQLGAISDDALQVQKTLYDSAWTQLDVTKAVLEQARSNENDTIVRVPFAGMVTDKAADVGEIVAPSAAGGGFTRSGIATVVDMKSLEVDVDVSENYIDRVAAGQKTSILLNAYPDWGIPGSVIAVVPTADQSKGTVKVRVGLDVHDERILPQMGARVSFLGSQTAPQARTQQGVIIPVAAVQGNGNTAAVFRIKDDGIVEIRSVSMGTKSGASVVIRTGLNPGDRVAVNNFDRLRPGVRVVASE